MSDFVIETKKLTKIYGEQNRRQFCGYSCEAGPNLRAFGPKWSR